MSIPTHPRAHCDTGPGQLPFVCNKERTEDWKTALDLPFTGQKQEAWLPRPCTTLNIHKEQQRQKLATSILKLWAL